MGFFNKLKEGLGKTKSSFDEKINGVFSSFRKVDEDFLEELEEALIMSDIGMETSVKIVDKLRQTIKKENLKDEEDVKNALRKEMQEILDEVDHDLHLDTKPSVILVVGVNGVGKTTSIGKIANRLRKDGKKPLLVACDVYRPAAIKQLQVIGAQLNIPVFADESSKDVVNISRRAIEQAYSKLNDVIIIDTAGRLQIDEPLMNELKDLKSAVKPHEILLVVDSMTGQEAVNVAESFNNAVGIDGIVLTKLDGDTRGGAALSVKKVTGRPIKYIATGEKMNDIEQFHPDRMASRILGMGDVLSIIEKAEEAITEEEAEKLEAQLRKNKFDLDDYLVQLRQIKKMGSLSSILKMIPGMGSKMKDVQVDDKEFNRIESMICSMTKQERRNPKIINGQRRLRIAKGSGTTVEQINKFMKSFEMTQKMMKQMKSEKGMKNMMRNLKGIDKDAFKDLKF